MSCRYASSVIPTPALFHSDACPSHVIPTLALSCHSDDRRAEKSSLCIPAAQTNSAERRFPVLQRCLSAFGMTIGNVIPASCGRRNLHTRPGRPTLRLTCGSSFLALEIDSLPLIGGMTCFSEWHGGADGPGLAASEGGGQKERPRL